MLRNLCSLSSKADVFSHIPVLANEVVNVFMSNPTKLVLDLTFGYGGHSTALLAANKDIKIVAIDRDQVSYQRALDLRKRHSQILPYKAKFSELEDICIENGITEESVDFILMDLGFSSMQMDDYRRGFSISGNGTLDMRMDQESEDLNAFHVINYLGMVELSEVFKKYGEERNSKKIAKTIVDYRLTVGPISTTGELANIVLDAVGRQQHYDSLGRKAHPATLVFQALRIFVNDELNELCIALKHAEKFLKPVTGRCAVISFHSLEDRIVKWAFTGRDFKGLDTSVQYLLLSNEQKERNIWKQDGDIICPTDQEILSNPRSRSAKMRIGRLNNNIE